MLKMTVEKITPEMAKEYLKTNKNNYRKMSRQQVRQFAEDMKAGNWELNGEAIEFNEDGILVNGQHRLAAIILSGKTIQTAVIRGVGNNVQIYDSGNVRSIQQIVNASGIECNSTISGAVNIILNNFRGRSMVKGIMIDYIQKNEAELNRAYRAACYGGNDKSKTAPCIAASYLMLRTNSIAYYELELFWRLFNAPCTTQYDGYDPSPAFTASRMMEERRKLSAGRQLQKERVEILVLAMKDFHEGTHVESNYKIAEPFLYEGLIEQVKKKDRVEV